MQREALVDLNAFAAVAEERSFTRASVRLGTSQSAISYAVRRLEERLGVRLLHRTTRSVAPTEAGQLLLETLRTSFEEIAEQLSFIERLGSEPSGTIRISTPEHAFTTVLWPKLSEFMRRHPSIKLEVELNAGDVDIVDARFDLGVRLGREVPKDMIAVPLGPELRMAVVASPEYFSGRQRPTTPYDLSDHLCINYRRPMTGRVVPWEFSLGNKKARLRVGGQLTFNNMVAALNAARAGHGVAYIPEDYVNADLTNGALERVLSDWCAPYSGFHLYYANRKQPSAALALLISALKLPALPRT
ncbi:LysR family transcriptional regulator [Paraburkholderia sp. JHI869]|uniref:LysR family transcriptional regulator n=1 Tax=Paraburkholderia sp. JHI869 TaxID=3112959 RepID=UPI0031763119